jgi:hypothetical protein
MTQPWNAFPGQASSQASIDDDGLSDRLSEHMEVMAYKGVEVGHPSNVFFHQNNFS